MKGHGEETVLVAEAMQAEGDQVHGVCGETVKVFGMGEAGQELGCETVGDCSPMASAPGPADCMPRGLCVGTKVGQRVQATSGPAGGITLKGLQVEQEMGRMGRRGFGIGTQIGRRGEARRRATDGLWSGVVEYR
jgi:hypothetical protein